jgi:hypothetical protein
LLRGKTHDLPNLFQLLKFPYKDLLYNPYQVPASYLILAFNPIDFGVDSWLAIGNIYRLFEESRCENLSILGTKKE